MKMEIKVPPLGESVVEATVSRIIADSGSIVSQDQEIIELETDKVNQVLYAPAAGELSLAVSVGQTVSVAEVIGHVDTDKKGEGKALEPPKAIAPALEKAPTPPAVSTGARVGIDTFVEQALSGSKAEKIAPAKVQTQKLDVSATASSQGQRKKMSSLRRTIAARLVEVKNTTAMLTTFNEVDMSAVMAIRAKEKDSFLEKYGVKLGFMSFFVKASASALKAFPEVNAYIDGDDIVTVSSYDIGVAVSTEKGLFVPVIRGCDTLTFGGIEKGIETYAKKAREGGISIDDMRGGSFTITNGGVFGSLLSTPILNPPQSAILGMHSIVKRAVVINDQIAIRPMMYLALSYDHRIIDGKEAVQFLVHIKQSLEDPSRLLLEL